MRAKRGFTLIELLVVVFILFILFSIIAPLACSCGRGHGQPVEQTGRTSSWSGQSDMNRVNSGSR